MPKSRRSTEIFSLSFLDCICCGFGAVVLFFTIVNAQSGVDRTRQTEELSAEVSRREEEVLEGVKNLVVLRNTLEKAESDTATAASRATRLIEELQRTRDQGSIYDATSLARREHIDKLKADVRALEQGVKRLEAGSLDKAPPGNQIKARRGADQRFITGLQLRGQRILVLLDVSASMLHDDVVNVIRLRNTSDETKRQAAKWRRAVEVTAWIASQMPDGRKYQVYGFNTQVRPLLDGEGWLTGGDDASIDRLLETLDSVVPAEGTSLLNAFAASRKLSPAPDQIILITDGLPTQGATAPAIRKYIDARGRTKLFDEAIASVSSRTPIDVVLLPMRGDNPAGHRFWNLARRTGGSYLMPSKDWP